MREYLLLAAAVCCEVFGDTNMKLSDGFRKKLPVAFIVLGYAASFYLLSLALQGLSLGFAYAIYSGVAIILTAIVGNIIWKEGFNAKKVVGLLLIIAGIALVRLA